MLGYGWYVRVDGAASGIALVVRWTSAADNEIDEWRACCQRPAGSGFSDAAGERHVVAYGGQRRVFSGWLWLSGGRVVPIPRRLFDVVEISSLPIIPAVDGRRRRELGERERERREEEEDVSTTPSAARRTVIGILMATNGRTRIASSVNRRR